MQNRRRLLQKRVTLGGIHRADELDVFIVYVRFDEIVEIVLILDYARKNEVSAALLRYFYCKFEALVRVYAAIADELVTWFFPESQIY